MFSSNMAISSLRRCFGIIRAAYSLIAFIISMRRLVFCFSNFSICNSYLSKGLALVLVAVARGVLFSRLIVMLIGCSLLCTCISGFSACLMFLQPKEKLIGFSVRNLLKNRFRTPHVRIDTTITNITGVLYFVTFI